MPSSSRASGRRWSTPSALTLEQETGSSVTIEPSLIETASESTRRFVDKAPTIGRTTTSTTRTTTTRTSRPTWAERTTTPPRIGSVAEARLNPRYLFENFVIGASNRFAHAAAVAVAEAPGKAYNPLFIYGDSGLGKTHLLHAIGHYVRSLYPGVAGALREHRGVHQRLHRRDPRRTAPPRFQRRYRDDRRPADRRHPVPGGQGVQTQEEFFHTFNTLHNANKQIVITVRPAAQAARRRSRTGCATGSSGA